MRHHSGQRDPWEGENRVLKGSTLNRYRNEAIVIVQACFERARRVEGFQWWLETLSRRSRADLTHGPGVKGIVQSGTFVTHMGTSFGQSHDAALSGFHSQIRIKSLYCKYLYSTGKNRERKLCELRYRRLRRIAFSREESAPPVAFGCRTGRFRSVVPSV